MKDFKKKSLFDNAENKLLNANNLIQATIYDFQNTIMTETLTEDEKNGMIQDVDKLKGISNNLRSLAVGYQFISKMVDAQQNQNNEDTIQTY